jgi:hypothetical protein
VRRVTGGRSLGKKVKLGCTTSKHDWARKEHVARCRSKILKDKYSIVFERPRITFLRGF